MEPASRYFKRQLYCMAIVLLAFQPWNAAAQTCQTANDIDAAFRTAITNAGQRYFDMVAKGNAASLRQNTIPSVASNFAGIETMIKDHQQDLSRAQPNLKSLFLLNAGGADPNQQDEFWCGVFNKSGQTPNSAVFFFYGLPAGKYAVVLMDANSPKGPIMFSEILEQIGNDWKFADLYIRPAQISGHDSDWFRAQAHAYKTKGQVHNAWFYYRMAIALISPMWTHMSTLATDQLYDEAQSAQPSDLPANDKTVDLAAGGVTYKLAEVFPQPLGNEMDLVVKYQSTNASNPNAAYQDNVKVMQGFLAKYPEVRSAFAGVVARAVDSTGRDYGTLLAMKDIK